MAAQSKETKRVFRMVTVLLPVAGAVTFAFPFVTKYVANKMLKRFKGFDGKVDSITSSFGGKTWRIKGVYLDMTHRDTGDRVLLFKGKDIKFDVDRKALWKGIIGGKANVVVPDITVMRTHMSRRLQYVSSLRPSVCMNKVELQNGRAAFVDESSNTALRVEAKDINVSATDITNISFGERLPCCVVLRAKTYGGTVNGDLKVGFMEEQPAFDLNMEVVDIDMPQLNNFFRSYGKFDVNKGKLGLYAEVASREGSFKGYVKPVIKDLDVLGPEDKGVLNRMWQGLIGATATILENKDGQIVTKIPLEGKYKEPKVNTWYAIGQTMANAFVRALKPAFDLDIDFTSVSPRRQDPGK